MGSGRIHLLKLILLESLKVTTSCPNFYPGTKKCGRVDNPKFCNMAMAKTPPLVDHPYSHHNLTSRQDTTIQGPNRMEEAVGVAGSIRTVFSN